MRISQAVAKSREIPVPFEGADLMVTYRPPSYTPREMDLMAEEAKAGTGRVSRRVVETMQKMVIRWDLEFDEGKGEGLIPIDGDIDERDEAGELVHPLYDVPSHIYTAIITAINKDMQPGGSEASAAS